MWTASGWFLAIVTGGGFGYLIGERVPPSEQRRRITDKSPALSGILMALWMAIAAFAFWASQVIDAVVVLHDPLWYRIVSRMFVNLLPFALASGVGLWVSLRRRSNR